MNMMANVQDVRDAFIELYRHDDFVIDKTGVKTLEIIGACFIANEPAIFGKPNLDYIIREVAWYDSMSCNVNDIEGNVPKIWKDVATPDGRINSNYGYLIYSDENHRQYENVLNELTYNPNSRRAEMIYTRPSIWNEYNTDGMSDFICTEAVQYFIRDRKLITIVKMRSCDAIFGYRNDVAWQGIVQNRLLNDLRNAYPDLEVGPIQWVVGSLHLYEPHFKYVEELL